MKQTRIFGIRMLPLLCCAAVGCSGGNLNKDNSAVVRKPNVLWSVIDYYHVAVNIDHNSITVYEKGRYRVSHVSYKQAADVVNVIAVRSCSIGERTDAGEKAVFSGSDPEVICDGCKVWNIRYVDMSGAFGKRFARSYIFELEVTDMRRGEVDVNVIYRGRYFWERGRHILCYTPMVTSAEVFRNAGRGTSICDLCLGAASARSIAFEVGKEEGKWTALSGNVMLLPDRDVALAVEF